MTRQEIIKALKDRHQKFISFILSLNEADFMFSFENKWTAGQQLDHICKATSTLLIGLKLPKIMTRAMFGLSGRTSVTYNVLVKNYLLKLSDGAKASGRYIPSSISFSSKKELSDQLHKTMENICKALQKYKEEDIDQLMLPHPILGKLTIREMLYFTIYHVEHHHALVKRNLHERLHSN